MDNHLLQDGTGEVQLESGVRTETFCCGGGLLPEGTHQILTGGWAFFSGCAGSVEFQKGYSALSWPTTEFNLCSSFIAHKRETLDVYVLKRQPG